MPRLRRLPPVKDRTQTTQKPLLFSGGINNTDPEIQTAREELTAGRNMFLDRKGGAYNRLGAQRKNNFIGQTTGILGLFDVLARDGSQEFLTVYNTGVYRDVANVWTALTSVTMTTNLKAEGVYFGGTNKFYITNGTDAVVKYQTGGTSGDQTDASFKKGTTIESFDNRLCTAGVATQEDYIWVSDLGADTFGSNSYVRCRGKVIKLIALQERLLLAFTQQKIYKINGFTSTPNAAGPESMYEIDGGSFVAISQRSIVRIGNAIYFVGLDSQNVAEVYGCDGTQIVPLGGTKIKSYLNSLSTGQLANIAATQDGRFYRFAAAPAGSSTNTREYLYDTLLKVWQPEFVPQFPISCYINRRVSGVNTVYAGHQSVGQVYQLNTGRYDEIIDQSFTTTQDTDTAVDANAAKRAAQGFKLSQAATTSRYVTGGAILMKKNAGTTTGLTVRIETDSAGVPSGTLVDSNATTTIAAFSTTGYTWKTFTFATPFTLTGSTAYQLVVKHTTEGTGDSQYYIGSLSTGGYANGTLSTYASSTWSASASADMLFVLFIEEHVESYVVQNTVADHPLYPKKIQRAVIDAQSSTGITAKCGISIEGRDGVFSDVDLPLSGRSNVWSSSGTDTTANHLVWANNTSDMATNAVWASPVSSYNITAWFDSYVPASRTFAIRFYFKGIGDFKIDQYVPFFEVYPSSI